MKVVWQILNCNINVTFQLPVRTKWDVERYADVMMGRRGDKEAKLKKEFPPLMADPTLSVEPGVIADMFGKIMVWYLPGILHPSRQVSPSYHNLKAP
jgi:hypothetical protein